MADFPFSRGKQGTSQPHPSSWDKVPSPWNKLPSSCASAQCKGLPVPKDGSLWAFNALNCAQGVLEKLAGPLKGQTNLDQVVQEVTAENNWQALLNSFKTELTLVAVPCYSLKASQADNQAANAAGYSIAIWVSFYVIVGGGKNLLLAYGNRRVYVAPVLKVQMLNFDIITCCNYYEEYATAAPQLELQTTYWAQDWESMFQWWVSEHAIAIVTDSPVPVCGGVECDSPMTVLNPETCECECALPASVCGGDTVLNAETCQCEEPPPVPCDLSDADCPPCTLAVQDSCDCQPISELQAAELWEVGDLRTKAMEILLYILTNAKTNWSAIKESKGVPWGAVPIWLAWAAKQGNSLSAEYAAAQQYAKQHGAVGQVRVSAAYAGGLGVGWTSKGLLVYSAGFEDCIATYWNLAQLLDSVKDTHEAILFANPSSFCSTYGSSGNVAWDHLCPA